MKTYKDSTLKSWTKDDLIEYIRVLEHNCDTNEWWYNRVLDINTKLVALLNENKIEWLEKTSTGIYQIKEINK